MKISIIGLGKLGLPLAATIASKNHEVIGVDINKKVISELNYGRTFLLESNLQKLITKFKKNISATDNIEEAVLNSQTTFIITPTPSKSNGYFSNKFVINVAKAIARALRNKKSYHLVVLVSTVMPGSTSAIMKLLEDHSKKTCSKDFGLCYNPEFIALGSVIYNLLNPDFILIGESDSKSGDILQKFYNQFCDNKPNIARMSFINAELTKISVNTFVTTKISYANMLAEICEKLPGGDVDIVTKALGLDARIGSKYLKGGPSFGGPCFPRDNIAFISLAKKLKSSFQIPLATHKTNLVQNKRLVKKTLEFISDNTSVGILGLSYKPFTDVVEESSGLDLAKALIKNKIQVNVHDPLALENLRRIFDKKINYFSDFKKCIEKSDIIVIACNWPQYKDIARNLGNKVKILIDPWRMINASDLPKNVKYYPFGLHFQG